MATATEQLTHTVALIGNPNTGKSTLFTALCGVRQRTGNFPGVTVEKKTGRMEVGGTHFTMVDLPGTYSLAPRSPDEMVAVDVLLGRRADVPRIDVVLCIVDASNLERNLYIVSQVLELGLPTVIALNMTDLAQSKGVTIDVSALERKLGVRVVPVQAHRREGIGILQQCLAAAAGTTGKQPESPFPPAFQTELAALQLLVPEFPRYLVERLVLDTSGYLLGAHLPGVTTEFVQEVHAARARLAAAGHPTPAVEAVSRYKWVATMLRDTVRRETHRRKTWSDRLDQVLTHRVAGLLLFGLIMLTMFMSVYYVADPASEILNTYLLSPLTEFVTHYVPAGQLQSLLVKGVIGGVGGVVVFLPQIFVLFGFIAILEDCGYMARAAYLMDRLMASVGLNGKSFIPLLSSFACAIPGIMGARVIENPRDRLVTILVAPLMSCSARLPVYTLLCSAFVPPLMLFGFVPLAAVVMVGLYLLGIVTAILVAWVLKKTVLKAQSPPFVMELPAYKLPSLKMVLYYMLERGWAFVQNAGTLILAVSVLVWAAAYYPHRDAAIPAALVADQQRVQTELATLDPAVPSHAVLTAELAKITREKERIWLEDSYLGRSGKLIEPVVRPLGWDWRIGCASIASFPAREVIVATLGIIFGLGEEVDEESADLRTVLQNATDSATGQRLITLPVALSIMVFFALCAQCVSTLVVMRRETNSWRWPLFTFVYMTTLAWCAACVTFQVGRLILPS
jgi:ferrous iron transport protein B